jgi:hypothetical protein
MNPTFKIVITAVVLLLTVLMWFAQRGDRGQVDARFWRGGLGDPFRQALMRDDGTLRPFTKPLLTVIVLAFLLTMWLG